MKSSALATAIAKLTLTKKAQDVIIMDLRRLTSMTDYFVICSADSESQIKAIADAVLDGTESKGVAPWNKETGSPNWMLLDYSDVVLHIFHKNTRNYYNLEKLWGDAKAKRISDEPPTERPRKRPVAKRKTAPKKKAATKKKVA